MDAGELKVVLDELREIHSKELERQVYACEEHQQQKAEEVCIKHGGHEFVRGEVPGFTGRIACKFCDKVKVA